MRRHHAERLVKSITRLAAEFLERHRGENLVTVNSARLDKSGRAAIILLTVYPKAAEDRALGEMRFLRDELRNFLDARLRGNSLTYVDFALDE